MPGKNAGDSKGGDLHDGDENDCTSGEIIRREFPDSTALITIGGRRTILNNDSRDGVRRFDALFHSLREVDELARPSGGHRRNCSWIIDAGQKSGLKELKFLQDCLLGLNEDTGDWLAQRSAFTIAHSKEDWYRGSVASKFSLDQFGSSDVNATKFYRTFKTQPWERYDAFTAFLPVGQHERPRYFGHRLLKSDSIPIGEFHHAHSEIRDSIVFSVSKVLRSEGASELDQNIALKLFQNGFLTLTFEEFLSIKLE